MSEALSALPASIVSRARQYAAKQGIRRLPRVFADTKDFTAIDYGDVITVDDRYFQVVAYAREGRFGVEEQVKQWVPKVIDLATDTRYLLKLVFHETFDLTLGNYKILCYRSPEKEARVLELVQGHERFMQGYGVIDEGGNLVRILDLIRGQRLDKLIHQSESSHEEYFFTELPAYLRQFLDCVAGIQLLHAHGLRHGDIRRDHIYVEHDSGLFKWIDFDYDFYLPERPFTLDLFELGNLLTYLVGRGNYSLAAYSDQIGAKITPDDLSLLSKNRIVNLRKLLPYIPKKLNNILMHFAMGTPVFYDTAGELHQELGEWLARG